MKSVYLGKWPFPISTPMQREWLYALPKMNRTGSDPYFYSAMYTRVTFKRNEDATAFKLKFGL